MDIEKLRRQTLRGRKLHEDIDFANTEVNFQAEKNQTSDECFQAFLKLTELRAKLASLVGGGKTEVCTLDIGEDYDPQTNEFNGLAKKLHQFYTESGFTVLLEPIEERLMMVIEWAPNSSCNHCH